MKNKKVSLIVLLLLGIGLTGVNAQEALPASGGDASGSGGSVSYSAGQVAYTTHTGSDGSVAQGVQQTYIISDETGFGDIPGINLSVSAYPNPVIDYLTLRVDEFDISDLSFQLYDINGKLIKTKKITGTETTISMANLSTGTYFLKVIQIRHALSPLKIKTFKIIKNH